jgi:C-terminal processing protease CtpA/Prc
VIAPRFAVAVALALAACGSPAVGSIGAVLVRDNHSGAIRVRETPPGLAADHAGVRAGDELLMIDGVYVGQLSEVDVRRKLRGEVGTPVELTLVRDGGVMRVRAVRTPLQPAQPPRARESLLDE